MSWQQFKSQYLVRFWAPLPAVIAAGILSTYYFGMTGTFWAVTGEFTRWGGHVLQWFGLHPEQWGYFKVIGLQGTPLERIDGRMIIGMFAGCIAAALWANNIKLRQPQHRIRIVQALLGGIIAGFGARLAMGCNLAAFFTGIPQFSLHAWFFALATAAGSYFGAKFTLLPMFRIPVKLQKVKAAAPLTQKPEQARRRFRLGMAVFGLAVAWSLWTLFDAPKLGIAMLFGIGFGLLIERAQICFTSAFRDLWITGRTHMAKAIIIGMAVSAIGIFSYVQLGVAPKIVGRPECGAGRLAVRLRHRAGRRLRDRLDVPRGGRAGALLVGRAGQYHRRHAAGLLLGRSGAGAGDRLRQDQPARHLRPNWWPAGDLSAAGAGLRRHAVVGETLFPRPA